MSKSYMGFILRRGNRLSRFGSQNLGTTKVRKGQAEVESKNVTRGAGTLDNSIRGTVNKHHGTRHLVHKERVSQQDIGGHNREGRSNQRTGKT